MTFSIKKKGGYLLPETTLKNKAEHEVTLIKRGFTSNLKNSIK